MAAVLCELSRVPTSNQMMKIIVTQIALLYDKKRYIRQQQKYLK